MTCVPRLIRNFPRDYGAIYSDTHRFCQFGAGKCEGIGRFMHIWQNKGGEWKVTRIISYDHKAVP